MHPPTFSVKNSAIDDGTFFNITRLLYAILSDVTTDKMPYPRYTPIRITQQNQVPTFGCTRQAISTEEQEARFKSQVQLLTSILARSVLPERLHKHFTEPEYQDDFTQLKKRIYR